MVFSLINHPFGSAPIFGNLHIKNILTANMHQRLVATYCNSCWGGHRTSMQSWPGSIRRAKVFGGAPGLVTYDFNRIVRVSSSENGGVPLKTNAEWFFEVKILRKWMTAMYCGFSMGFYSRQGRLVSTSNWYRAMTS